MDSLTRANLEFTRTHPGESGLRQPVHVVYGGAHLFRADLCRKVGRAAKRTLLEYAPDAATFGLALGIPNRLAEIVYESVKEKLDREPVEDYRLDFEDGFGVRPDAEEDQAAETAAAEVALGLADGTLPAFIGIRIKPLNEEWKARSLRTLEIFMNRLGRLPQNFTVTLPKITVLEQVSALAEALDRFGVTRMELMIETPQSLFLLPRLIEAAGARCAGAHFGIYDYTAALGITAPHQHMLHPACDFARSMLQAQLSGTGIALSDGATNILPVAPYRQEFLTGREEAENRGAVHRAWKLHAGHIRHSLEAGFFQGWDLHPAQLPSRYAAVYSFFLDGMEIVSERLRNFISAAAKATMVSGVFDDAATGQGLLNYFVRAMNCGAVSEDSVLSQTGLTPDELRSGSFVKILDARRVGQ